MRDQETIIGEVVCLYDEMGIGDMPFGICKIYDELGIIRRKYSSYSKEEQDLFMKKSENGFGFLNPFNNKYMVYYNDATIPKERIRFTLAHELGHFWLGHNLDEEIISGNELSEEKKDENEREANLFALILLTPLEILFEEGYGPYDDYKKVSEKLNISYVYAARTIERLDRRLQSCYQPSLNELKLKEIFYKNKKKHNKN